MSEEFALRSPPVPSAPPAPTHEELVQSLVADQSGYGRIVWSQQRMGSWWLEGGTPVPDVMVMRCSYTRPDCTIFEVKTSRADFQGDVRRGKWKSYLPMCSRLLFAAPAGVIRREDLPEGCGLATWTAQKGWHISVAGARRPDPDFSEVQWMSLLFAVNGDKKRADTKENRARNAEYALDSRRIVGSVSARIRQLVKETDAERKAAGEIKYHYRLLHDALKRAVGLTELGGEHLDADVAEALQAQGYAGREVFHWIGPVVCPWSHWGLGKTLGFARLREIAEEMAGREELTS